jgi:hypothetical protein
VGSKQVSARSSWVILQEKKTLGSARPSLRDSDSSNPHAAAGRPHSSSASAVPPIFFSSICTVTAVPMHAYLLACNAHACIYAEQRPAAPSGHAQPSGRRCSPSINQSINQSCKMQSFPVPSNSEREHSIKHFVSSRLASHASKKYSIAASK